eukprot:359155-Chlamydomonas_euryale.AAC.1
MHATCLQLLSTGNTPRLLHVTLPSNAAPLACDNPKFQHTGKLGKELGATVPVGRALLDAQQHNSQKEQYTTAQQRYACLWRGCTRKKIGDRVWLQQPHASLSLERRKKMRDRVWLQQPHASLSLERRMRAPELHPDYKSMRLPYPLAL